MIVFLLSSRIMVEYNNIILFFLHNSLVLSFCYSLILGFSCRRRSADDRERLAILRTTHTIYALVHSTSGTVILIVFLKSSYGILVVLRTLF